MTFSRVAVASRHHRYLMTTSLRIAFILALTLVTGVTVVVAQKSTSQPVARLLESGRIPPDTIKSRTVTLVARRPVARPATARPIVTLSVESMERRAFDLINAQRRSRGQRSLPWDPELARLARQHSENMARGDFFNHMEPGNMTMVNRARAQGIRGWSALGENIAYNQGYEDPAGFVAERWMNSSKHRENLLNSRWTRSAIGVAIAGDGRVFFTQVFIAP